MWSPLPRQVYERVATHARAGHFMGGSCFWCLTAAGYPDYDGFKVSSQQQGQPELVPGQAGTEGSAKGRGLAPACQVQEESPSVPMQQGQGRDILHSSASSSEGAAWQANQAGQ